MGSSTHQIGTEAALSEKAMLCGKYASIHAISLHLQMIFAWYQKQSCVDPEDGIVIKCIMPFSLDLLTCLEISSSLPQNFRPMPVHELQQVSIRGELPMQF